MSRGTALRGSRPPRLSALRGALTPREWASLGGMSLTILLLHAVGWGLLVFLIAPANYQVSANQAFGVGLGVTAYTLGMRHAFDADHIAAIDNTTRKMLADGKRPLSVGFWFSLGHASVVFVLCLLLAAGVRTLSSGLSDGTSALHSVVSLVGTAVSGFFLLAIGLLNLVVLRQIVGVFRGMRAGTLDEGELEAHLNNRGFLNRVLGKVTRAVTKPWHMFPVGLLFGIGFDTATEVGLLVLAGGAAALSLPWYAILTLPLLFAAGMSLLDTIDGCFMNFAYGWAFSRPVRKVYYNMTVTALSVAVALVIGTIEVVSIVVDQVGIDSGPIAWVGGLDLNTVGFVIVALFAATWLLAAVVWHGAKIEQRWDAGLLGTSPELEAQLAGGLGLTLGVDLGVEPGATPA